MFGVPFGKDGGGGYGDVYETKETLAVKDGQKLRLPKKVIFTS